MRENIIKIALNATKESADVEFKRSFNPNSNGEWLEILKDFMAITNSGGGVIVIGVDNQGIPSGADTESLINYDPAKITDKIESVTGLEFEDFRLKSFTKKKQEIVLIIIGPSLVPIPFKKAGQYKVEGKKTPIIAFQAGTVYFRHGAKSAPGTFNDINKSIERRLDQVRKEWFKGVQKVVNAKPGSIVQVLPPEIRLSDSPNATPFRFVDDPSAPGFHFINPNSTHPYRLKDALEQIIQKLGDVNINWYDLYAVRKAHGIENRSDMFFNPMFGSPQYSHLFISWVIKSFQENPLFFKEARISIKRKT